MASTPEQAQTPAAGGSPIANSYDPSWRSRYRLAFQMFAFSIATINPRDGIKHVPARCAPAKHRHKVPAAMFSRSSWRRIVILRFFVAGTFASNPKKVRI